MQPVAAADALALPPGALVNTTGRRGGLASLFVRGGESRYNKVLVDDVAINDPGGTFDFGVVPMGEVDRVEFVRGAESTLYGSDADDQRGPGLDPHRQRTARPSCVSGLKAGPFRRRAAMPRWPALGDAWTTTSSASSSTRKGKASTTAIPTLRKG